MHYKSLARFNEGINFGRKWPSVNNYRYPRERWMLFITIIIIGLTLLSTGQFDLEFLAFFFVVTFVINYIFIRAIIESFKRDSIEVTDTQFPEIKALVDECRHYVDIPTDTRVFVSYSPVMNAFAMGLSRPYSIVLFSALVDNMDADELKYVISHEMGHIKFGHTIWLTLIGRFGVLTYGIPMLNSLFQFFFLFWRRMAEVTADRAGLVGCGRLDKAISAQVKFGAGPWLAKHVDTESLAKQAREAKDGTLAAVIEVFGSHPMMTTRIRRLVNFAASETFRNLRPDIRQPASSRAPGNADTPVDKLKSLSPGTETESKKRVNRRLVPGGMSQVQSQSDAPTDPSSVSDVDTHSYGHKKVSFNGATKPTEVNWSQELGFSRLNVSAVRANAEQAEMWLRMGELLQSNGQANEAAICLQRAKGLLTGTDSSDERAFSADTLSLAAGKTDANAVAVKPSNTCPTCSHVNPQETHYCGQCQTQLQKPCLECGTWLPSRYPNCTHCGHNQAQLITLLKSEARTAQKHAEQTLPPKGLTKWEHIYTNILMLDIVIVLGTLAWQSWESAQPLAWVYIGGAGLTFILNTVVSEIVARRRKRNYWRLFDEVDLATRRYNDIANTLAQQHVTLDPPRLEPKDPWRWAHQE